VYNPHYKKNVRGKRSSNSVWSAFILRESEIFPLWMHNVFWGSNINVTSVIDYTWYNSNEGRVSRGAGGENKERGNGNVYHNQVAEKRGDGRRWLMNTSVWQRGIDNRGARHHLLIPLATREMLLPVIALIAHGRVTSKPLNSVVFFFLSTKRTDRVIFFFHRLLLGRRDERCAWKSARGVTAEISVTRVPVASLF